MLMSQQGISHALKVTRLKQHSNNLLSPLPFYVVLMRYPTWTLWRFWHRVEHKAQSAMQLIAEIQQKLHSCSYKLIVILA